jgi:hypothetical protein
MGRPSRKLGRKLSEADVIAPLELRFTDPMLLHVMIGTEADHPAVGGLERQPAVRAASDVSAFTRMV